MNENNNNTNKNKLDEDFFFEGKVREGAKVNTPAPKAPAAQRPAAVPKAPASNSIPKPSFTTEAPAASAAPARRVPPAQPRTPAGSASTRPPQNTPRSQSTSPTPGSRPNTPQRPRTATPVRPNAGGVQKPDFSNPQNRVPRSTAPQNARLQSAQGQAQSGRTTQQRPQPQRVPGNSPRPNTVQRPQGSSVVPARDRNIVSKPATGTPVVRPAPGVPVAKPAPDKAISAVPPSVPAAPAYAGRRSASQLPPAEETGTKVKGAEKQIKTKEKPQKKESSGARAGADMMSSVVKGIIYIVLVLVVSVFISVIAIKVGNDVFAFVKSDEAIDITIPEEATTADIAKILSENGIIKYPGVFKMYASLKNEKGDYLAGDYTVSPAMSYDKLRGTFKKQIETGTCWITFPEGYTTDEIIDLLVKNGIGTREGYIDVINNGEFDYWFVKDLEAAGINENRAYRLDGYLFPDSYEFYKASSEELVINRMLARFEEVFVEDYKTKAEQLGYTVDEILIIASLVEKEAGKISDFMYVSSAFHNRLKDPRNFPRMESDATVVYAIQTQTGTRPNKVTPEDLKFENPYNTYLNAGLTPGPITNPSASAIRYALYPAETTYKYFVSANNGTTLFGSSRPEHEQNIETVKKMNEQG